MQKSDERRTSVHDGSDNFASPSSFNDDNHSMGPVSSPVTSVDGQSSNREISTAQNLVWFSMFLLLH